MRTTPKARPARSERYPLAAIVPYGPDDTLATKLVVSVLEDPDSDPVAVRTWHTVAVDVRTDPTIAAAVEEFLVDADVRDRMVADRILGCPHEETVDYPLGRICPKCPFWAGIDRFTHEPIVVPEPSLSAAEVLDALCDETPERRAPALASADAHRAALVEPLLAAIDRAVDTPVPDSKDARTLSTAIYLLAKWRESRAYRPIVRWLSLPAQLASDMSGDIITQDGSRILASVCDRDLAPLRGLILNRNADEFARESALNALALLGAWGEVPRPKILDELAWLASRGIEREPSAVWCGMLECALDLQADELRGEVRRAYAEGLIDPQYMSQAEFAGMMAAPPGALLARTIDEKPPIGDVAEETSWWSWSDDEGDPPIEPVRAPPAVGRNQPCPCGSGKKSKRCCGA